MAAQAALIADTITGMKRALRREREENGPDDPIMAPTNRGNKMHANAKYVSEGALGYINAEDYYKQRVDHAGYTRYILQPNPVRYDSEGEELVEDDEDSEADAAAAEENPFSGIALETLLCPLKHPSELPTHPSMSQAYTSQALEKMTSAVEHKLRQERALLWRARSLHRQFLGDSSWMPCGALETPNDHLIFDPRLASTDPSVYAEQGTSGTGTPSTNRDLNGPQDVAQKVSASTATQDSKPTQNGTQARTSSTQNDVEMAEVPAEAETAKNGLQLKSEETDATVKDLPPHPNTSSLAQESKHDDAEAGASINPALNGKQDMDTTKDVDPVDTTELNDDTEQDQEMHDGSSPEPPRRMTTRAQANAVNPNENENGSPLSSETAFPLPTPHPLFLVPDNIRPDPNFGLPAAEAEETRRLLWSYIQKQEETVRGVEHMLDSLNRSCRMKADVLEWCKAEGHVGEMSDGEDWYDREQWGLAEGEDLKKGTDEDEVETVDESRTQGKRGRGRRQ
ncbi:hypothetical protein EN45_106130 [Penicillium chrysogenum]|uniref:Transcriptional regulatory protein RXT2 N-terminal domain-containing protein n=1 Tax=Penicillium chrysogenum TaxID=5076 RepID=A0A167PMP1_PENCH|nr:uncharacterized protein N7525_011470 [Penicillium rubens]KAJ5037097.1 hypothetical protein NUH16_004980 [Penicillium rubens]KAJ5822186.1 hypothetical protein N7525_011470 [Penicillium rubens]KAJ5859826.1 hypothetical protein N7534_005103 [Penicillium rubens]KZN83514.1 hypothetical protein EN45_106130 [Penicillium chrysogenum]